MSRHRAHWLGEVAPASAQRVGQPSPQLVDAAADLLQPRPRRGDHANRPAAHAVGKAQPHPVDNGRAAVGSHDQQPLLGRRPLERDLVLHRDVVAKEKDVPTQTQRLAGHASGVAAWHRDQHPLRLGQHLGCRLQALGEIILLADGPFAGEQPVHLRQRRLRCRLIRGTDHDDQVVGRGGDRLVRQQTGLSENLLVRLGAHHHASVEHAWQSSQRALQLHQDDRVIVRTRPDFHFDCHIR